MLASYQTWATYASERGFHVIFFAESDHDIPFPVKGLGHSATGQGEIQQAFMGFQYILKSFPNASYVFKSDDDTFVNVDNLWKAIQRLDAMPNRHWYIGDCGSAKEARNMPGVNAPFCGGGSGFLISRPTLESMVAGWNGCEKMPNSDTTTSYCSVSSGTPLTNHEGFFWWPPQIMPALIKGVRTETVNGAFTLGQCSSKVLSGTFVVSEGWLTYHHLSPWAMYALNLALVLDRMSHSPGLASRPLCAGIIPPGGAVSRCDKTNFALCPQTELVKGDPMIGQAVHYSDAVVKGAIFAMAQSFNWGGDNVNSTLISRDWALAISASERRTLTPRSWGVRLREAGVPAALLPRAPGH